MYNNLFIFILVKVEIAIYLKRYERRIFVLLLQRANKILKQIFCFDSIKIHRNGAGKKKKTLANVSFLFRCDALRCPNKYSVGLKFATVQPIKFI